MSKRTVDEFIQCLKRAETSNEVEPLVDLFSEDATASNFARTHGQTPGKTGIRRFWNEYLNSFKDIRSEFIHVAQRQEEDTQTAVLEWESNGHLKSGAPIRYCGVSVLDLKDGKVCNFRTYYDSAAFLNSSQKRKAA